MAKTDEIKSVEETEIIEEPETKKVETKTNDVSINIEKAKAIFEVMPHITTIWFDKKGEWRFYPTPGSVPIHKEKS